MTVAAQALLGQPLLAGARVWHLFILSVGNYLELELAENPKCMHRIATTVEPIITLFPKWREVILQESYSKSVLQSPSPPHPMLPPPRLHFWIENPVLIIVFAVV